MVDKYTSNSEYILLPTVNNPKVVLNLSVKKYSFDLYNPHSLKAQILKRIAYLFPYFNKVHFEKSEFVKYLERKLEVDIYISIYTATDKDKYVLQVCTAGKTIGYIKISNSKSGFKRIENEIKAIRLLKEKSLTNIELVDTEQYQENIFLFTSPFKILNEKVDEKNLINLLSKYKKNIFHTLKEHPRIQWIQHHLETDDLRNICTKIIIKIGDIEVLEVYEHGDCAPWNLCFINNEIELFDFEYFFEKGLEYFDLIKYFFQIETLLNGLSGSKLIETLTNKLESEYAIDFIGLFLLKEIIVKKNDMQDYQREISLLNILNEEYLK